MTKLYDLLRFRHLDLLSIEYIEAYAAYLIQVSYIHTEHTSTIRLQCYVPRGRLTTQETLYITQSDINNSLYSFLVIKQIIILLRYTITNSSRCSPRILLIRFQNITDAFINPNYITNSLYSPSFNLKAIFYLLPFLILI